MSEAPECCDGCTLWKQFGSECWVYWERKKTCTQHTPDGENIQLPTNPNLPKR